MEYKHTDSRTRLINEICAHELELYRETIELVLKELFNAGAKVSCRTDVVYSNIDPHLIRPYHIRISLLDVKKPLNILWDLLHEFGHYLDWPRDSQDTVIQREVTAWLKAHEILKKYPQLKLELNSFNKYKDWCLSTYYKKYGTNGLDH